MIGASTAAKQIAPTMVSPMVSSQLSTFMRGRFRWLTFTGALITTLDTLTDQSYAGVHHGLHDVGAKVEQYHDAPCQHRQGFHQGGVALFNGLEQQRTAAR